MLKHLTIEHLPINYRTIKEIEGFGNSKMKGLSIVQDMKERLTENRIDSPYFGIYFVNQLVGILFVEQLDQTMQIVTLEVLPNYRYKGLGSALIEFVKSFKLPIQVEALNHSCYFWHKMGFEQANETTLLYTWAPNEWSSSEQNSYCMN